MARRYEFVEGTSKKFWEIELEGESFTARWGRIGTDGQQKVQDFDSPAEARKAHDKLCAEKEKKGYQLVSAASGEAPVTHPAQANEELEAKIALAPGDEVGWKIYADWLLEKSEPWGEVIAQACGGKPNLQRQQEAERAIGGGIDGAAFEWAFGAISRFELISNEEPDEENTVAMVLARALAHPAGRLVRTLTLGLPPRVGGDIDWHYEELIGAIGKAGPLPLLEKVDLSPDAEHMDQTSWRRIGDLRPLWKAAPRLKELRMQGASGSDGGTPIKLGKIDAPHLETFAFESGGLDESVPKDLGAATLPKLKHLELMFGREDYGCSSSVKSLAGILSGKGLPKLETLGLKNSEWEVELIDAIASSKVLPQLKVLDLSMGVLFQDGAAALIKHQAKFAHLKKLILDDNYLEAQKDALAKAFPMVELGEQRELEGEPDDEYSRYTSVGE